MSETVLEKPTSPSALPSCTDGANLPGGRRRSKELRVAVLTGGWDKPHALGIGCAMDNQNIALDFIGSDEVDGPELRSRRRLKFLNLRGDQNPKASRGRKVWRIITYYWRLITYRSEEHTS